MQELVICKTCKYVMEKRALTDKCPACGVPSKMFESYVERLSTHRKNILKMDLHPILVHFTQAFAFTIPLLCGITLLPWPQVQNQIHATITVLAVALPIVVLLSFLAGMLDGKIRFRRVTTPLLKTKLLCGAVLFLLSCAIAGVAVYHPSTGLLLALSVPAAACASFLGLIGVRLLDAAFPG